MAITLRHNILTAPSPPTPPVQTWPNNFNTGVPRGTALTAWTGGNAVNTPNTLIENKIIGDVLEIHASNVTLRNCRVQNYGFYGLIQYSGTGTRIENCDFNGYGGSHTSGVAIGGDPSMSYITGSNIRGTVILVKVWGPLTMTDSFLHNLYETDPNPDARHFDGFALHGGGNCVFDNNAIIMPDPDGGTSCAFITCQEGNTSNVTVSDNLLAGKTAFPLYATNENTGRVMTGIVITNNYLDKGIFGWANIINTTPVYTGNIEFDSALSTPATVASWMAAQWPSASTVGCWNPAGLTAYSGPTTISAANTTVADKIITSQITVTATGVTFRNCRFNLAGQAWAIDANTTTNLSVEDCEISGAVGGVRGQGWFNRVLISGCSTGITLRTGTSTVRCCYIHSFAGAAANYYGIVAPGGQSNCLIEDNLVNISASSGTSAAILVGNRVAGAISNTMLYHNRLLGTPTYGVQVDHVSAVGTLAGTKLFYNEVQSGSGGYFLFSATTTVQRVGNRDALTRANIS
jgi:hypothetical protein